MVVEVALSCKLRCLLAEKVLSLSVACFGCVEIGACSSKECEGGGFVPAAEEPSPALPSFFCSSPPSPCVLKRCLVLGMLVCMGT